MTKPDEVFCIVLETYLWREGLRCPTYLGQLALGAHVQENLSGSSNLGQLVTIKGPQYMGTVSLPQNMSRAWSLKWSQLVSSSSFCSFKATELCTAASTAVALLVLMVGKWEVRTGRKPDVSTASAL